MLAKFDNDFLQVPSEALISAMESHQKSFSILDDDHKLMPNFIFVSNIQSKKPQQVVAGNECVMRARLADAAFFYHQDCKRPLIARLPMLEKIIYQRSLGTLADKATRISALAVSIAQALQINTEAAAHAGLLAKADLATDMVGEFPELQGIMGSYYALHDGEPETIANAIKDHYLPRFSGDALPSDTLGCAVAIADRLDTLIAIFGINKQPTGDKDPFALRRAALGLIRIIIEKQLTLDLNELLQKAQKQFAVVLPNENVVDETYQFILERVRGWYLEQSIAADVIACVIAHRPTNLLDFHQRLLAVNKFRELPQASSLASANKRVSRILQKEASQPFDTTINSDLLIEPSEQQLATLITQHETNIQPLLNNADYQSVLADLSELRPAVDDFFDNVMVMADDPKLRANRIALLAKLRALFLHVADISLLQETQKEPQQV